MQTPTGETIFGIMADDMANVRKNAILYVPSGTIDKYSTTGEWREFENILEFDPTGVSSMPTDNSIKEVSRYSLDGHRLSVPTKGVNIVKFSNGTTKKVVIR